MSGNPRDGPEEIPLVPSNTNVTSSNDNEDDDDNDGDDDEPLLVLDDESTSNQNIYARNPIGFRLQSILYHFVAEPVVKGRAVIFVICIFILAGSAVLVSKLQVFYAPVNFKPQCEGFGGGHTQGHEIVFYIKFADKQ